MASARARPAMPTTMDISTTSGAGRDVMTRRTTGRWLAISSGPSLRMCDRARSVVHGVTCAGGREPASVSASTCANRLGHSGPPRSPPPR